jgi:hypothetical protein
VRVQPRAALAIASGLSGLKPAKERHIPGVEQTDAMNVGWVWTNNLQPFLEVVSRLLDYDFDDLDWVAVQAGLPGTDSERGPWFDYPIGEVAVHVAYEPGADEMVTLRLDPVDDRDDITLVAEMARTYELRRR